jgi:probable rRNA maturation factor
MINLLIADAFAEQIEPSLLEKAALAALRQQAVEPEQDLSIVLEEDERLHQLNKEFLDIDSPTDVLSFPAGEEAPDPRDRQVLPG